MSEVPLYSPEDWSRLTLPEAHNQSPPTPSRGALSVPRRARPSIPKQARPQPRERLSMRSKRPTLQARFIHFGGLLDPSVPAKVAIHLEVAVHPGASQGSHVLLRGISNPPGI